VRELAEQMVQGKVSLAAGGIDDPENPLGTDAIQVNQAIASVYSDEGVVVLMDLGSALMSAEMALEFLPEEQRTRCICAKHHSWRARSRQQWRLLLEVTLSRFWLSTGGADSKSSAIGYKYVVSRQ